MITLIQKIADWLLAILLPDPAIDDPQPTPAPAEPDIVYTGRLPEVTVTAKRLITSGELIKAVAKVHGGLNHVQASRLNFIAHYLRKFNVTDLRKVAYVTQTAWHEMGGLMHTKEIRARKGTPLRALQNRYWPSGYYGRGYIHVTWKANYKKIGDLLNIDLVRNPDFMEDEHIAAEALVLGMKLGVYTGRKLNDYFNVKRVDWVNARRIVNGLDLAHEIGVDAEAIYRELKAGRASKQV